jgi:hypothetical protein
MSRRPRASQRAIEYEYRARDRRLQTLGFCDGQPSYSEYLASRQWERARERFEWTVPRRCFVCWRTSCHAHHCNYRNLGRERSRTWCGSAIVITRPFTRSSKSTIIGLPPPTRLSAAPTSATDCVAKGKAAPGHASGTRTTTTAWGCWWSPRYGSRSRCPFTNRRHTSEPAGAETNCRWRTSTASRVRAAAARSCLVRRAVGHLGLRLRHSVQREQQLGALPVLPRRHRLAAEVLGGDEAQHVAGGSA